MSNKDVFILGAGFSKAISPEMPTLRELTSTIKERLKQAGDLSMPAPLGAGMEDDIELWMTYLSHSQPWLDKSSNQYNKALATRINQYIFEAISESTASVVTSSPPEWLPLLIHAWHQRSATVITLNYDTLVERAAIYRTPIRLKNIYPDSFSDISSISKALLGSDLDTFKYYKLHGSVNWHYSGREDFYGETIYYSGVTQWGGVDSQHEVESKNPASDKEVLAIPPVSEKTIYFNNEHLRGLWISAGRALAAATRVFVIGYSLPVTDMGMGFFLSHSLPAENTAWHVVDIDESILPRFEQLLAKQHVSDRYVHQQEPVSQFASNYAQDFAGAP